METEALPVLTEVLPETSYTSILLLCRICAQPKDRTIELYGDESITNELSDKITRYLPIVIDSSNALAPQVCWDCATSIFAWHEFVQSCIEADCRFRQITNENITDSKATSIEFIDEKEADEVEVQNEVEYEDETDEKIQDSESMQLDGFEDNVDEIKIEKNNSTEMLSDEEEDEPAECPNSDYEEEESEEKTMLGSAKATSPPVGLNVFRRVGTAKGDEKLVTIKVEKDKARTVIKLRDWSISSGAGDDYSCSICHLAVNSTEELLEHLKEHGMKTRSKKVKKAGSGKERRRNTKHDQEAINEAKVVVEGRVYYNCKICGKSLHSPYTFIWHMRIHTGERPFVCDLCGKQFRVSQGLVRHLKETHEGIKNFPCDLCGRMFATRRNVEEHRRIHTNERPYVCDLCGKSFKQKASLFVHNRSHTDSFPHRCSYCKKGFRTRPPLLIHITRHTGEKPYPCDVCGRRFRIKYELKRHMLIHSDEKPFTCDECGLSFRQKRYLRNHVKINHTDSVQETQT